MRFVQSEFMRWLLCQQENEMLKDNAHWTSETYTQRITTKEWRQILLDHEDSVVFEGRVRKLKAKPLGAGVVEIYKVPLAE